MIIKKYIEALDREVSFAKRKGTKHIRLSLKTDGSLRVSVPYGVPQIIAEKFMLSKLDWINDHAKKPVVLSHNDHIGKSHQLQFVYGPDATIKSRVSKNMVTITYPVGLKVTDSEVQTKAKSACERALKLQAAALLPIRLDYWSKEKSIPYASVSVKKMKSRWGSCDNRKNIIFNIYLLQLDWALIDYVILHELSHTYHPHHQKAFWDFMETVMPDYKSKRKTLKLKPTDILQTNF
jgi:predicted metal-dependent hydrolase